MPYLLNLLYLLALALLSPWLLYKTCTTGKYRRGLWTKLTGHIAPLRAGSVSDGPTLWFHGVSVGEIHLLRQVIARFRQRRPDCRCVVSTTTDTGLDEARKCFPDLDVILWPLDFSWAVTRALDVVKPDLLVLAEGEIWPNMLLAAKRRRIPVAILNARLSPRSTARYRKVAWLARALFGRIDLLAAQTEEYAANFRAFGAPNVLVTGSVKYDGARGERDNPRTADIARLLGLDPADTVWVAGSTQAPEESICVDIFRRLREKHPQLKLIIVPRQKDRFDEVARLLSGCGMPFVRRSEIDSSTAPAVPIILVDTIGELGALWGRADLAFVGGSLDGKRGGQNMIEPAAYGAAVLFGPHTWNFKETVNQLLANQAALRIADAGELEKRIEELLNDGELRERLGTAARRFVLSQQGATERTLDALDRMIPIVENRLSAA